MVVVVVLSVLLNKSGKLVGNIFILKKKKKKMNFEYSYFRRSLLYVQGK
jgi:hypothetical protein